MTKIGYLGALSFAAVAIALGCSDDRPSYAEDLVIGGAANSFGGSGGALGSVGGAAGSHSGASSSDQDASVDDEDAGDEPPSSHGGNVGQGGSGGQGGQGLGGNGGAGGSGGTVAQGGTGGQGGSGGQSNGSAPVVGTWVKTDGACTETHTFGATADNFGNLPYIVTYSSGKHLEGLYSYMPAANRAILRTRFNTDNLQADCAGSTLTQVPSDLTRFVEVDATTLSIFTNRNDVDPELTLTKQ